MKVTLPLWKKTLTNRNNRIFGKERRYVSQVLDSGFRSSSGSKFTRAFEERFASEFGVPYAIAFTNGTATLHAALEAFGVGPGDEVIVPPLTMSATAFAVLQANATPVFADVDKDTFQISIKSIEAAVTSKTKAIITVALYGLGPDLSSISKFAKSAGLWLLEDNAECYLATHEGSIVGTFGDAASYSLQSSKHLTSGEGGVLITKNLELAEKVRKIQSLGYAGLSASKAKITKDDIQDPNYSRHVSMGWNYRMPELCAAVALAQIENIDRLVGYRVSAGKYFESAVLGYEHILTPQLTPENSTNTYWTFAAALNINLVSWTEFRSMFLQHGGDPFYSAWKLTYLEPMFQEMQLLGREEFISKTNREKYKMGLCPVSEDLQPRLLQFKTNYWDKSSAKKQALILRKVLQLVESRI